MYSPEQLKETAAKMQAYLEEKSGSEPNELIERLENLQVMVAKSGNMLADAKYYQDMITNGAIMEALKQSYEERLSPSTINKFVTTAAKDQNYLVVWFDRINSAAGKQMMAINVMISYRKTEMQL